VAFVHPFDSGLVVENLLDLFGSHLMLGRKFLDDLLQPDEADDFHS